MEKNIENHPVPAKYHKILFIGNEDRRGNIVDFKIPPIITEINEPVKKLKQEIFRKHVSASELPYQYNNGLPFLIVRPTGLDHCSYVREQLGESRLKIKDEFELDNFILFADSIYDLLPCTQFHWEWRIIMNALHESGIYPQNKAYVFILDEILESDYEHNRGVMAFKKRVRKDLGELPVIVKHNGKPVIGLGIHHLHAPDFSRINIEYNALMHAFNKSSIFAI